MVFIHVGVCSSFYSSPVCQGLRDGGQEVFVEKENPDCAKNIGTFISTAVGV